MESHLFSHSVLFVSCLCWHRDGCKDIGVAQEGLFFEGRRTLLEVCASVALPGTFFGAGCPAAQGGDRESCAVYTKAGGIDRVAMQMADIPVRQGNVG